MKLKQGFDQALKEVFSIDGSTNFKEHSLLTPEQFRQDWITFDGTEAQELSDLFKALPKRAFRLSRNGAVDRKRECALDQISQERFELCPSSLFRKVLNHTFVNDNQLLDLKQDFGTVTWFTGYKWHQIKHPNLSYRKELKTLMNIEDDLKECPKSLNLLNAFFQREPYCLRDTPSTHTGCR